MRVGDTISISSTKVENEYFKKKKEEITNKKDVPQWLELDAATFSGKVISMPTRTDIGIHVDPQAVVEYYSK